MSIFVSIVFIFIFWTLWDKVDKETSLRAHFSLLSYERATSEQIPVGFPITLLWSSGSTEHLSHQSHHPDTVLQCSFILFPHLYKWWLCSAGYVSHFPHIQDNPDVSPSLSSSKRLSRSNVDLSAPSETRNRKTPLSRKQSDSYDGDSSGSQHHPFLSRYWMLERTHTRILTCF